VIWTQPEWPYPKRSPAEWSEEEKRNAMTYFVCRVCGEPRQSYLRSWCAWGYGEIEHGIRCPNGHEDW
jgi:hypothetical protein